MSSSTRTRYPGAQPFADDDLSHRVFFGRRSASITLTNQILANRLVVVFGRSGLGKTSLLHAGVAPRLRDEGHLPLSIRLNDTQHGLVESLLAGIEREARRQGIEYVPGATDSLWAFFRTVEFWRGDQLLVPVLILDQFEELFTLQTESQRVEFLSEIARIVRGTPPEGYVDPSGENRLPALRVVLSLREDYLALLEEASDQIPEILSSRFRIAPLSIEDAEEALVQPARLENSAFDTPPFSYEAGAARSILDFLSHRRTAANIGAGRYVDPFQLQLICQRVEHIVAQRGPSMASEPITLRDIGGTDGIEDTLKRFYLDILASISKRHDRRGVQRLCQEHLISPESRRLSLDEDVIVDKLRISPELLRDLVARRLLRVDHRADSRYYELSHDALVDPVLAAQSWSALWGARLQIVGTALSLMMMAGLSIVILAVVVASVLEKQWSYPGMTAVLFIVVIMYFTGAKALQKFAREVRDLRRYRGGALKAEKTAAFFTKLNVARISVIVVAGAFFLFDLIVVVAAVYLAFRGWTGQGDGAGWSRLHHSHRMAALPWDWLVVFTGALAALPAWGVFAGQTLLVLVVAQPLSMASPSNAREGRSALFKGASWILASLAMAAVAALVVSLWVLIAECRFSFDGNLPEVVPASRLTGGTACDCQRAATNPAYIWFFALIAGPHVAILIWGVVQAFPRGFQMLSRQAWRPLPGASDTVAPLVTATRVGRVAVGAEILFALLVPTFVAIYLPRHRAHPVAAPAPASGGDHPVVPAASSDLHGRVVDARGRDVEGAIVRLISAYAPYRLHQTTRSGRGGAYSFAGVGPWPVRLVAEHGADGVATSAPVRVGERQGEAPALALSAASAVHGTVIDSKGRAVGGATVFVEGLPWTAVASTNVTGAFHLTTVPDLATGIVAIASGYKQTKVSAGRRRNSEPALRIALASGAPIRGEVRDGEDKVVANARVVACENQVAEVTAHSDARGRFELPAYTAGCEAVADHPKITSSPPVRLAEGVRALLRVSPGGGIAGRVVDGSGARISRFQLAIESFFPARGRGFAPDPHLREAPQLNEGFNWYDLAPGTYVLVVSAAGSPPSLSSFVEVRSGEVTSDITIAIPSGGTLKGTVRDQHQKPIAGAEVTFDAVSDVFASDVRANTDEGGTYHLRGAPSGPFSVRITKHGFRTKLVSGLYVEPGASIRQDVILTGSTGGEAGLEFGGIGARFTQSGEGLALGTVYQNDPADLSGLRSGDRVLAIDGNRADGYSVSDADRRIRGEAGTKIVFTILRPATLETLNFTVVRQNLFR